jgi:hypothetical protein
VISFREKRGSAATRGRQLRVALPAEEWRRDRIRRPASEAKRDRVAMVAWRDRERGCGFRPGCRNVAAGRRFMVRVRAWQRCRASRRQAEMELRRVGPDAESGDQQVGPHGRNISELFQRFQVNAGLTRFVLT